MLTICFDDDIDDHLACWTEVHLSHYLGLWDRLKHGLRFILGLEPKACHFDNMFVNARDAAELAKLLGDFAEKYKEPGFSAGVPTGRRPLSKR